MERPDDCPDPSGNGGGCDALQRHTAEHGRFLQRLSNVEISLATMRIVTDATREDSRAIRAVVCGPANEALAKYASDHPPELLDVDDGEPIPTSTAIQVPHLGLVKIRREQRRAVDAEKARDEADMARVRLEGAKLRAEERAAELADRKAADDKRHARIVAALAAISAVAVAVAGALALLGKFVH
ncbi:MAG: hypothetical protein WDA27_14625 [Actinomycetota bacterium]